MHVLRNKQQEETIAFKLFNKRFAILVQNKAFYSTFELEEIGFTSCGTVADNQAYLNEFRLIQTTLDKIVEWNARGDMIKLTDLKDATTMYKIMDEHMNNWLIVAREIPSVKLPPIEDFEALDKLCEMLHPLVDINVDAIEDPNLLLLFGNALNLSFMIGDPSKEELREPYHPYSPKLYTHTRFRWEK